MSQKSLNKTYITKSLYPYIVCKLLHALSWGTSCLHEVSKSQNTDKLLEIHVLYLLLT